MKSFSKILLEWHNPSARNLPWKNTNDAYKIWLSEIILQQTRVEQGTPYYLAFIKKYPTVKKLAAAPLDDVLKLWEGLGYYSRARNLHSAAKQIVELHNGKFPATYTEIIELKGIGNYTAAAIASFAYDLPYAVVDGNVFRVLSRVFGIETPIDTTQGKKQFEELANKLLDKKNAAIYNQAIMDFGALVCKPQQPLCSQCPYSSVCKALTNNIIDKLPVKSKKIIKTTRHFHFFVLIGSDEILLQQRTAQDIWKGLFSFPFIETNFLNKKNRNLFFDEHFSFLNKYWKDKITPYHYRQSLSHQNIQGNFYEIRIKDIEWRKIKSESYKIIRKNDIKNYAFPKLIRDYLKDRFNYLS